MKILGLSCSPRKQGNTMILMEETLNSAKNEGAEVELYSVAGKNIKPCDGCWACEKTSRCHIKDDMQELYEKILQADGIIFGTPVYFYSMTAQAKAVIDRTIVFHSPERSLANKVGGVIVTAGSQGTTDALKDLYFFMVTRQILPANFVAAYTAEDPRKMPKCMQAANDLGRQMVRLIDMKFKYPGEISRPVFSYGTHTH